MKTEKPTPYVPPKMVTHRQGAERAAAIPSRENGRLVPAARPGHMCVGVNGRMWLGR